MIDITKQYTTAFNDEVKLYEIIDDAVFGRIKIANSHHPIRWNIDGINGNPDYNLIPLPDFKITEITNTKTVNYFGQELSVPVYARYIATDVDGDICAFEDKPILADGNFINDEINFTLIAFCKFNGDYTQSIVEI